MTSYISGRCLKNLNLCSNNIAGKVERPPKRGWNKGSEAIAEMVLTLREDGGPFETFCGIPLTGNPSAFCLRAPHTDIGAHGIIVLEELVRRNSGYVEKIDVSDGDIGGKDGTDKIVEILEHDAR